MDVKYFETILQTLAEKITAQENAIFVKDYEISELKRKLAEAEGMETEKGVENE